MHSELLLVASGMALLLALAAPSSVAAEPRRASQYRLHRMVRHAEEVGDVLRFESLSEAVVEDQWQAFKVKHAKSYVNASEEARRRTIFAEKLAKIERHNELHSRGLKSFHMGINQFSDMSHSEFLAQTKCLKVSADLPLGDSKLLLPPRLTLPKTIDWRTKGIITKVKNQGGCGACYAFAAVGTLEAYMARKTKKLVPLSEQNVIDCSSYYDNEGCNGGYPDKVFQYIKENGGVNTEAGYPYEEEVGLCRYDPDEKGGSVKGWYGLPAFNESALELVVSSIGPVAVGINARLESFSTYKGGVYYDSGCKNDPDHAVVVVGFGQLKDGTRYWIVRNSWGDMWGAKGYILMARGRGNHCGILSSSTLPDV